MSRCPVQYCGGGTITHPATICLNCGAEVTWHNNTITKAHLNTHQTGDRHGPPRDRLVFSRRQNAAAEFEARFGSRRAELDVKTVLRQSERTTA